MYNISASGADNPLKKDKNGDKNMKKQMSKPTEPTKIPRREQKVMCNQVEKANENLQTKPEWNDIDINSYLRSNRLGESG